MRSPQQDVQQAMLNNLQRGTGGYFVNEYDPDTGLIADKTKLNWPASIAATGFGLSVYPILIRDDLISREEGVERTLKVLRFLHDSPQSRDRKATGYKGFYYHFINMRTGEREWRSELSTVDSAFLIAGALLAQQYFERDTADEAEIRRLADAIYRRVDWAWALNGSGTLVHGWRPERGFMPYHWAGYDESLLLYILALGSPTSPIPPEAYRATCSHYRWKRIYGREFLYAGPLFIHQYPHIWVDFRELQDTYMKEKGSDYWENSRHATYVQQEYAIRNPKGFEGYGEHHWGITASDGPGPDRMEVDGKQRTFYDYVGRGVPFGPDDGTIAPWAAVASLPFAPEIVLPTIRNFNDLKLDRPNPYGYKATINQTYPDRTRSKFGWVSPYHYAINQGPIILMIENYQTEMTWQLMRRSEPIIRGLRRAGFSGGWLADA